MHLHSRNAFQKVVCEKAAILSRPLCVNFDAQAYCVFAPR